jgi:pimeloyl-ACP methyl ester carboxylesterase/DNA-binding CsgD family transcriptional regulator
MTPSDKRIAYALLGRGSPLVFPAWWINHLEVFWEHPTVRGFFHGLARDHTVVIYDRQGCGLSDRSWTDYSLQSDLEVLETIVDHLGFKQLVLCGFSHGGAAAVAYAVKHPDRVSKLILYGVLDRPTFVGKLGQAAAALVRANWGLGSRTLTDMIIPGADQETVEWFARWQRESASVDVAIQVASLDFELSDLLPRVRTPTLVMHRQEDTMMPFREGMEVAAQIPGARFVRLPGRMHPWFLGDIDSVLAQVRLFLGDPDPEPSDWAAAAAKQPSPATADRRYVEAAGSRLTRRERDVAVMVAGGMSTRQIAGKLVLSERTVEGHIERLLNKLGFHSRAQIAAWAVASGLAAGHLTGSAPKSGTTRPEIK